MTAETELAETVERLAAEQTELVLDSLTLNDAWALGSIAVEIARERELPVVIEIRRGEQEVFHAAMEGTNADNDTWVARKAASVRRYAMSSLRLGLFFRMHGVDFHEASGLAKGEFVAAGGCIPLEVRSAGMVGTLAVSGLTDEQDHALAVEALRRHLA
ncbi:heme-degrading domain-containing protein [Demequina zhanjiangensis]|uniref:Heme-degrading domain-containing protein n=1 Tax=Demequina zhanjiangensis TaxID=3051659 RepID=A0ABT8FZ61_9MICO|nr:heme-degrading domain-containing protein [Demequina sp. SYSU T00b26]MDN4472183.1 heme-degrading domain-containing protein [Demequina sp. SYSU T00b26]